MTWNKTDKNSSKWLKKRGTRKVYRGTIGALSRGEIALTIHGDASATVTREDMEDYFGTRQDNNFAEISKNTSNWGET